MTDCLIVGQGIAGTCLAHELTKKGLSICIVNDPELYPTSQLAAAIINPVTGRNWVKTWNADMLLPLVEDFYSAAGQRMSQDQDYLHKRRILLTGDDPEIEEAFMLRTGDPLYHDLITLPSEAEYPTTAPNRVYGIITRAYQLDMGEFIVDSRIYFKSLGIYREEHIGQDQFVFETDMCGYGGEQYRWVIFCEGSYGFTNPWFDRLPFKRLKGELLICEIPELETDDIIKGEITVVPLPDPYIYWVGSTYERDVADDAPTKAGRAILEEKLRSTVQAPFTTFNHQAGIRPASKDRRPYIGFHPQYPNLGIINGLGTKGASLGPYSARVMANAITEKSPIPRSVNIMRYWKG